MSNEQQSLRVRWKAGKAKGNSKVSAVFSIPLEADGTLHKRYDPFLSIDRIDALLDSVEHQLSDDTSEDKAIHLEDAQALWALIQALVYAGPGLQMLKVLREHVRSTQGRVGSLLRAVETLEKLASAEIKDPKTRNLERYARDAKKKI